MPDCDPVGIAQVELADALSDEWPDTSSGWATFHDKYALAGDIVAVLLRNDHVRSHLLVALAANDATYVAEGWWHPNVKAGQVHDHLESPGRGWSEASHRLCESVYTKRGR